MISLNTGGMFSEGFNNKRKPKMKKSGYGGKGLPKGSKKGKSCRKKK